MRFRNLALFILIPLLLVTAVACAGKKAATPAEQALMDTGEKLKSLSADYVNTNAKYVTQCAAPRVLDAVTCDAWVVYTAQFVKTYASIDADWRLARSGPSPGAMASADARAVLLAATLKTYTDKTK